MDHITHGYLEIILGPMFSGKTSKLIDIYKQYTFCNISVLVVNHSADTRYSQSTELCTHDGKKIDCMQVAKLQDVLADNMDLFTSNRPVAVLINEGQFFPDLYRSVFQMVQEHHSHVYVAGLDGDFNREKFGQMLDLIPLSDKVYKLTSLCVQCKNGTRAVFSHRMDKKNQTQIQIGSNDAYIPLCRGCYVSC